MKLERLIPGRRIKKNKGIYLRFEVEVGVEVEGMGILLAQEWVDGHPDGQRGVKACGYLLGVPESLAGGEKGLVYK
jgi:hypothetical protein